MLGYSRLMMRVRATERDGLLVCANVLKKSVGTKNAIVSMMMLHNDASLSCMFFESMLSCECVLGIRALMNMHAAESGTMINKNSGVFASPTCQFVLLISLVLSNKPSDGRL